jgi:hypothetical protein
MTEMRRLLDSSASPALRALLDAGLSDAPSAAILPTVRAALVAGCVVPTQIAFVSPAAAQVALASPAAVQVAPSVATATPLLSGASVSALPLPHLVALVAKPLLVGILGGSVLCGGAIGISARIDRTRRPTLSTHVSALHATPPAPAAGARGAPFTRITGDPESAASVLSDAADLPAVPDALAPRSSAAQNQDSPGKQPRPRLAAKAEGKRRVSPVPSPVASNTPPAIARGVGRVDASAPDGASGLLRIEIEQIDRARRALAAGNAAQALATLDLYDAQVKLGVLRREALLLRVDIAHRQGNAALTRQLAARYLARFPNDAHARRLQELVRAIGAHP